MQMATSALCIEVDVHRYQGPRKPRELAVAATVVLAPPAFPLEGGSEEEQRMTVWQGLPRRCTVRLHQLELEVNRSQKWLLDLLRRLSRLDDHRGHRGRMR
jgi:hypothetical protein